MLAVACGADADIESEAVATVEPTATASVIESEAVATTEPTATASVTSASPPQSQEVSSYLEALMLVWEEVFTGELDREGEELASGLFAQPSDRERIRILDAMVLNVRAYADMFGTASVRVRGLGNPPEAAEAMVDDMLASYALIQPLYNDAADALEAAEWDEFLSIVEQTVALSIESRARVLRRICDLADQMGDTSTQVSLTCR